MLSFNTILTLLILSFIFNTPKGSCQPQNDVSVIRRDAGRSSPPKRPSGAMRPAGCAKKGERSPAGLRPQPGSVKGKAKKHRSAIVNFLYIYCKELLRLLSGGHCPPYNYTSKNRRSFCFFAGGAEAAKAFQRVPAPRLSRHPPEGRRFLGKGSSSYMASATCRSSSLSSRQSASSISRAPG